MSRCGPKIAPISTPCEPQADKPPSLPVLWCVRPRDPVELVRADAAEARWELTVDVVDRDGWTDFRGPEVQGKPGERFIYLTWGEVGPVHRFEMFRRAKVMLNRVAPDLIESARASGTIVASIDLTGDDGSPRCARVDPPAITWTIAND